MGRLSTDLLEQIRKNPPTYWLGSRGITLFEHIDAIEGELKTSKENEEDAVKAFGQAMKDIDRLTENVAQLKRELDAKGPGKVVLPKEVAEAIEYYRSHGILNMYGIGNAIYKESSQIAVIAKRILTERFDDPRDMLMTALVNGYTVEKTKEERLREGVETIYDKWVNEPVEEGKAFDESLRKVLHDITDFVIKNVQ